MGCGPSNSKPKKQQETTDQKDMIGYQNFIRENKHDPRQDYKFGRKLGEGSYGIVQKVQHNKTKDIRAMKCIPKSTLSTTEQKLRLVNDIEILRELTHPNVIKVYEFYQDDQNFYVASEYCKGGELFARIEQEAELTESEAAHVMKQVLEVLQYCKKQRIAHRDLKPDNIMIDSIDKETGTYEIKIIDWGCSKKYSENNPTMKDLVGTPYYIAPEVINQRYNYKCDMWSLGVILFTLLCGEPCFTGNSREEVMEKVSSGKFQFEQPIWEKISSDAKNLISRMLTLNIDKRIDPSEALSHPWIQNAPRTKIDPELMRQTREKMKQFRCQNQLGYAVLSYISSQLIAKDKKQNIIKAFKELDTNGDGTLTRDEILEYYKKTMTPEAAEEEVVNLMARADQNNNNQINYEEFVVATMDEQQIQNKEKIKQAFDYFDQDGNGEITAQELRSLLGSPGMDKQQMEYWQQVIKESDKDGDQKINFDEFADMIEKQLRPVK